LAFLVEALHCVKADEPIRKRLVLVSHLSRNVELAELNLLLWFVRLLFRVLGTGCCKEE
jgi:hypothetical protein